MPELPEVERFRQILLPLVSPGSEKEPLSFELHGEKLPRKWVSEGVVAAHTDKWHCVDVLRKGKQLCMVLEPASLEHASPSDGAPARKYFFLHMGMTGRLASPSMSCSWGHNNTVPTDAEKDEEWPPKFTYLMLTSGGATSGRRYQVAFADPRKFGSCKFADGVEELEELAPDGLTDTATATQREAMAENLANQRLGIKALLLDQKRVVAGIGNWVADEVLYQSRLHPDQARLTTAQALLVVEIMQSVLSVAVGCLERDVPYPESWLFGYRWTKKKAGKDFHGRSLSFVVSGGRTSAIAPQIQKLTSSDKCAPATGKEGRKAQAPKASMKSVPVAEVKTEKIKVTKKKEKRTATKSNGNFDCSKKRKNDNKETPLSTKRCRRKGRTIDVPSKKGQSAEAVCSAALVSPTPLKKRAKSNAKFAKNNLNQKVNVQKTAMPSAQCKRCIKGEEKEKEDSILKLIDQSVKDDFRTLGFAKWRTRWLPIAQLGPFDVGPGPVRDEWMKRFRKTNVAPRLVYWYGSPQDDLSRSFSFVKANSIVGYAEGVERNYHKLQVATESNNNIKKLTPAENLLVAGLAEIKDEVSLSKKDRLAWLKVN